MGGNACWGGTDSCVACNGPSAVQFDVEHFFGRGLYSPKLKKQIDETCVFPTGYSSNPDRSDPFGCELGGLSQECEQLLDEMNRQVGPHNTYFIYDNCANTEAFLKRTGTDMVWLRKTLRGSMHNVSATRSALRELNGGYPWDCLGDAGEFIESAKAELHLGEAAGSRFDYTCSGPASITLWPELVGKIDVLLYSGDSDACVPYLNNEKVLSILEDEGALEEKSAWSPWFGSNRAAPAGYITHYQKPGSDKSVAFATIRLAGHMAPQYQPEPSLVMITDFFKRSKMAVVV